MRIHSGRTLARASPNPEPSSSPLKPSSWPIRKVADAIHTRWNRIHMLSPLARHGRLARDHSSGRRSGLL
jgi:hypothetical protein